jgi:hypothetical protein
VRRIPVDVWEDLPGWFTDADPIGWFAKNGMRRNGLVVSSLRDWEQMVFFAEDGEGLRISIEEPSGTDLAFCVDVTHCGEGHGPGEGESVDFVATGTGFHMLTILPEGHDSAMGPYNVRIEPIEPDFPDSQTAAWPLAVWESGAPWSGAVNDSVRDRMWETRPDVDWFRFWVGSAATPSVFTVKLHRDGATAAPRAEVRNADGSVAQALPEGDTVLTYSGTDAGWKFIRVWVVRGALPSAESSYSLEVVAGPGTSRSLCPTLPASPDPSISHADDPCFLGEGTSMVLQADLGSPANRDQHYVCLKQDQPVAIFLADQARKMRMELRPLPGGRYQVPVQRPDFVIMSADDGNVSARGPVLHFVSPDTQCYKLTVRASFGADRVANSDARALDPLHPDDDSFVDLAPYTLFTHIGAAGEVPTVPTLYGE